MIEGSPRRLLVTGAAAGIGFAIARRMHATGAALVMCDRDEAALHRATESLASDGVDVTAICADLIDAAAIERVSKAAGLVDGLVNCAGIYPVTELLDLAADEWDSVFAINLRTPFLLTQAVARQMIGANRGGCIVNISSTASLLARPGIAHYGASKAGLNQLTRIMAIELAPYNIRVNAILPGVIETARVTSLSREPGARAEMAAKRARIPMGRLGTADEVAELAAFLLSPASSYSTGGLFTSDGGFSLGIARY